MVDSEYEKQADSLMPEDPVPRSYQRVIIWGGMHGVIPIAIAMTAVRRTSTVVHMIL